MLQIAKSPCGRYRLQCGADRNDAIYTTTLEWRLVDADGNLIDLFWGDGLNENELKTMRFSDDGSELLGEDGSGKIIVRKSLEG